MARPPRESGYKLGDSRHRQCLHSHGLDFCVRLKLFILNLGNRTVNQKPSFRIIPQQLESSGLGSILHQSRVMVKQDISVLSIKPQWQDMPCKKLLPVRRGYIEWCDLVF